MEKEIHGTPVVAALLQNFMGDSFSQGRKYLTRIQIPQKIKKLNIPPVTNAPVGGEPVRISQRCLVLGKVE